MKSGTITKNMHPNYIVLHPVVGDRGAIVGLACSGIGQRPHPEG